MTAAHPTRTAVPAAEDVEYQVAYLRAMIDDESERERRGAGETLELKDAADMLESLAAANAKLREGIGAEIEYVAALRARVAELEAVIAEHNKRCERECDSRLFGSLPRRYLIEVPK